MKLHLLLLMLIITVAYSCNDDSSCGTLDWLDEEIQTLEQDENFVQYAYISQAEYNGMTVYVFQNCCPNCNTLPPRVVNCSGDLVGHLGDGIEADELKNKSVIWKPDNSACSI